MPDNNYTYQGQVLVIPDVYVADNVRATAPVTGNTQLPLAFIAYGFGGVPASLVVGPTPTVTGVPGYTVATDSASLRRALRGAPAKGFAQFIFNPTSEAALNGAQTVYYINASGNTQSTATVVGGGATPTNIFTLTSVDYGTPSNSLQYKVEPGTVAGVKMTILDGNTVSGNGGSSAIGDNLGVPLTLFYTGAAASPTYTITQTGTGVSAVATAFTFTSSVAGESFTLDLTASNLQTVSQLAAYLNGRGYLQATVVGDGSLATSALDAASIIAVSKAATTNTPTNITATLGAIAWFVKKYASAFCTAVQLVASTPAVAPSTTNGFVLFSGATSVPPTNQNYADALTLALSLNVGTVFVDNNSSSIQALLAAHLNTANQVVYGKFRMGATGSALAETDTTAIYNARAINSNYCVYAYPGVQRIDVDTGVNTTYSGLYSAAAVAGMMSGSVPEEPLMMKHINGTGMEKNIVAVSQIDALQKGGVMVLRSDPYTNTPQIVSDLTTWQNDNNPSNVYVQAMRCRQTLWRSFQIGLKPFVGTIASPQTLGLVRSTVITILNGLLNQGRGGILASWDVDSLKISYDSTVGVANITVSVSFVGVFKFILPYVYVLPLKLNA